MTNQMKEILKYLALAESTLVHRWDSEADITAPYGILKSDHPNEEIFDVIDRAAFLCKTKSNHSADWTKSEIDEINLYIKKNDTLKKDIDEAAALFYKNFLIGAQLEMFNKSCVVAMYSMYTHSPKNAWKAVQFAINTMIDNSFLESQRLKEDGKFGQNTKQALLKCKDMCEYKELSSYLFESYMLFGMTLVYTRLVAANPEKHLIHSIGWDNRMKKLIRMK